MELSGIESGHPRGNPERKWIRNLVFYCNIREIIPDFEELNFEHKNDINTWKTAFGELIRGNGSQNWVKRRSIDKFANFR